jgi:hypothetical protein
MIPRRTFLAALPPCPAAVKQVLHSPKDQPSPNKPMRRPGPMPKASIKLATAQGLSVTGVEVNDGFVKLDWIGGRAPYAVQIKIDDGPWTQVGNSTVATTKTFPIQGDHALLRIMDNVSSLFTGSLLASGGSRLDWTVPDLV